MRIIAIGRVSKRERLRWRGEFRPETIRLELRAVREIAAADPSREAEEVLNQRRCARLSARGIALQDHCIESFRSGVDGCGQTGRSSANNRYIATYFILLILSKRLKQTRHLRDCAQRGTAQWHSTRRAK